MPLWAWVHPIAALACLGLALNTAEALTSPVVNASAQKAKTDLSTTAGLDFGTPYREDYGTATQSDDTWEISNTLDGIDELIIGEVLYYDTIVDRGAIRIINTVVDDPNGAQGLNPGHNLINGSFSGGQSNVVKGNNGGDLFGFAIEPLRNLNSGTKPEFLVSAIGKGGCTNAGNEVFVIDGDLVFDGGTAASTASTSHAVLSSPDPFFNNNNRFGQAIAATTRNYNGQFLIAIGEPGGGTKPSGCECDDLVCEGVGNVYIYRESDLLTGTPYLTISAPDGSSGNEFNDSFGHSLHWGGH